MPSSVEDPRTELVAGAFGGLGLTGGGAMRAAWLLGGLDVSRPNRGGTVLAGLGHGLVFVVVVVAGHVVGELGAGLLLLVGFNDPSLDRFPASRVDWVGDVGVELRPSSSRRAGASLSRVPHWLQ